MNESFWEAIDELCRSARHVVDRPAGTSHPRYPHWIYPLDYGYLDGTTGGDGHGIDVWFGSAEDHATTAIACSVDPHKRDSEVKYLWRCTPVEVEMVTRFYADQPMKVLVVQR